MNYCPTCQWATTLSSERFCYKDGTPLLAVPTCACGRELLPTDRFCSACGGRGISRLLKLLVSRFF